MKIFFIILALLVGEARAADMATVRTCRSPLVQIVNGLTRPTFIEIPLDPKAVAAALPETLAAQPPPQGFFARKMFNRSKFFHRINENLDAGKPIEALKAFQPGKEYNVIITEDRLIASETGRSKGQDLVSKHIALADVDKPVRFAGVLKFDESGTAHVELRNESGTFQTPAQLLPAAKGLLEGGLAGLSVSTRDFAQAVPKKLGPSQVFNNKIREPVDSTYQQEEFKLVDEASDIEVLRLMRTARKINSDPARYKEWEERYARDNDARVGGRNADIGKYEIGKQRPVDVPNLLNALHGVMREFPELTPHFSQLPDWSPQAKIYLRGKFLIPPAKSLITLSLGRTRQYMTSGLEGKLEEAILKLPDKSVQIHDLFREAYKLAGGDVTRALLAAENVLTRDNGRGTEGSGGRGHSPVYQKFAYIRNDSHELGDNYGAWYHLFGVALYTTEKGYLKARVSGEIESLLSHKTGPKDAQEEIINRVGADLGAGLRKMVDERAHLRDLPEGASGDYMRLNEFKDGKRAEAPAEVKVLGGDKNKWITATFWHGMNLGTWLNLWRERGFRVKSDRRPTAASITVAGMFNSALSFVDNMVYARRVEKSQLKEDPIFILGHWRSGTTLLHDLMVLDENHIYPNCYQCAVPSHFLLTEKLAMKVAGDKAVRRPMDNMVIKPSSPQEDEFGMVNLGAPSPYRQLAFGQIGVEHMPQLTLKGLSPTQKKMWREELVRLFKRVAFEKEGTLVVKSPTHTARVEELRKMFPNAKYVHIARDPYKVFPSTMNLWEKFLEAQGVDVPKEIPNLKEYVFEVMDAMYAEYYQASKTLDKSQLIEIKYEDLVKNPEGTVGQVYSQLGLPDFDKVAPKIRALQKDRSDYKTNKFEMDADTKAEIRRRWAHYFERFGYN